MSNEAEREAFEAWMKDQWTQARDIPLGVEAMQIMGACSEVYWQGWKARADWQRAQQSAQAGYVALGEQAIIDQQAARIAELQLDADRYRWLRHMTTKERAYIVQQEYDKVMDMFLDESMKGGRNE